MLAILSRYRNSRASDRMVVMFSETRQRRQHLEYYQIPHDHDYNPAAGVEIDPETGLLRSARRQNVTA